MLILDALKALCKKATTKDSSSGDISGVLHDMAENWPSGGSSVAIDSTLTKSGQAADAKAVGDALAGKVGTGDAATSAKPGLVKQGAAVANAAAAPTQEEFNALLASLRAAGIIANS